MTSPISAIGAVGGIAGVAAAAPTPPTSPVNGPNTNFASMLADGLQTVQGLHTRAGDLATQVADGTLTDPAQYTMAATEASLALDLTVAIRNKAVEAFQEIMRMQA